MLRIDKLPLLRLMFGLLAVAAVTSGLAAAAVERASAWREHEIVVDGLDDDWRSGMLPVKGQRFSLGLVNDGQFLYLCLPTKDATTRGQIARQGLVVWIDKDGGKKNQFGVHFPIRLAEDRRRSSAPDEPPGTDAPPKQPFGGQNEIGILGPGLRKAELVLLPQAGGIEARVGLHGDLLVYELKVPLERGAAHPYSPNVKPGDTLRLQVQTPAVPGGRAPLGQGPGGVPIYGGGTGGSGGVGISVGIGGPPMGSPAMLPPLDVPMKVRLAKGPAGQ